MPFFLFIYSMKGLMTWTYERKYEPFRQEVSVESPILRWLLWPVGLLFIKCFLIFYSITLNNFFSKHAVHEVLLLFPCPVFFTIITLKGCKCWFILGTHGHSLACHTFCDAKHHKVNSIDPWHSHFGSDTVMVCFNDLSL